MATGGTHSQGVFGKVLFEPAGSPHTFDSASEAYEILSFDFKKYGRLGGHHGIRGVRGRLNDRVRELPAYFHGTLTMLVSPGDFITLLPKLMGGTVVVGTPVGSSTYSLGDVIPYFGMLVDLDYNSIEYKDCKIDRWVLRSRAPEFKEEGEPDMLYLSLSIIGSDEAVGTTVPAALIGTAATLDAPYTLADSTGQVTIVGAVRPISEFVLAGNNYLYAKYVNDLRPHSIMPRDREIAYACRVPWIAANLDLYNHATAGAVASHKFVNGTVSTLFTLTNLHLVPISPAIDRGKQEVTLELSGFSTATGLTDGTLEMQIVSDSTV